MPEPAPPTARRRYRRQLREAALRSTALEYEALTAIEHAVRAHALSVPDASERLRAMLREQHDRHAV